MFGSLALVGVSPSYKIDNIVEAMRIYVMSYVVNIIYQVESLGFTTNN